MTLYTIKPQKPQHVYLRSEKSENKQNSESDRLQDNGASASRRTPSGQPAASGERSHVQELTAVIDRLQNRPENSEKLEKITAYIPKKVKAELKRLADQGIGEKQDLSFSVVAAAFLVMGVQHNVNLQYGALLQPVIEKVIREEMQGFKTHLAWLLVRIAFDTGQTRSLATNILNRQPGLDNDAFRSIVTESAKAAKSNLTRRTPQLTELYEAVERWMAGENTVSP